ncbi:MAG: hypothetical protein HRT89_11485 [Lentisphaeria bacterium]|nr:hypothetical protein [Lentisphaeria bacterium]NQZ68677.1 hypothetical protein [Lentisphaeria bacterium]
MKDAKTQSKSVKIGIKLLGCVCVAVLGFSLATYIIHFGERRIQINQKAAEGWLEEVKTELNKKDLLSGHSNVRALNGKIIIHAIVMNDTEKS